MVTNGDEFTMGSNTKKVTQTNQTNRRISWISGFHGIQISKRKTTKCFGYLVVSARKILVKWHHFPRVKIKNKMKPPTSWKRDSKLDIRRLFTNDPVWWTWFSMHSLIWSTGSPFPPRKGVWFSRSPSASDLWSWFHARYGQWPFSSMRWYLTHPPDQKLPETFLEHGLATKRMQHHRQRLQWPKFQKSLHQQGSHLHLIPEI